MARKLHLAAYDICEPRRLHRALLIAREFATGGQKSVHEVWLDERERHELLCRLRGVLDSQSDRFFLLRLDPRQPPRVLGIGVMPEDLDCYVVG